MLFEMLLLAQRQAAQQIEMLLAAGRVQWQDEVRPSNVHGNSSCISNVVVSDASVAQRQAGQQLDVLTDCWQSTMA